jgi:hypothetical protein
MHYFGTMIGVSEFDGGSYVFGKGDRRVQMKSVDAGSASGRLRVAIASRALTLVSRQISAATTRFLE